MLGGEREGIWHTRSIEGRVERWRVGRVGLVSASRGGLERPRGSVVTWRERRAEYVVHYDLLPVFA